jgi:hypothetical protein
MIEDRQLLMKSYSKLFVLNIDYELWEVSLLSKTDSISEGRIIMDELNKSNFIIHNSDESIVGTLTDGGIVLSEPKQFNLYTLIWKKLVEYELYGFRIFNHQNNDNILSWKYIKIDLDTLREETNDVKFDLNENYSDLNFSVSFVLCLLVLAEFRISIVGLEIDFMLNFTIT